MLKKFILFLVLFNLCKPVSDGKVYSYMGKVCIEGHIYYQFNAYAASTYAIKLDNNGMPIKCENEY